MTINVAKLRFDAELAIYDKLSTDEVETLRVAIERVIKQHGVYGNLMIGQNTLQITGKK